MDDLLTELFQYLKLLLGILLTAILLIVAMLCDALRRRLNRKLELEQHLKEAQLLDRFITDAVRAVEEESRMERKATSQEKEDKALELVHSEAKRKGLGNPIPSERLRSKIRAKVHELYNSQR
jgi:ABC-type transport system involved in cytochrome bd biosynthesis fused ATPase/permease subunit